MAEHVYRVVRVYDDGEESATVQFSNLDYAIKLWHGCNEQPYIARAWIERREIGEWEVCSSETGAEFMALSPLSQERNSRER